ncbi:DUF3551 domain-containing protein [Bradyrhizobium sp. CCGE-LA001]|uniref:DUF3551 domain-containing protein n=1 Tax=Bradyrhizobium sp. CCGE-LA001 TaxID=1223566 RepID=UPI0002AAAC26|nr:DUF3551 domain-containing protein [Bradyrhizobium sp. CCGE-LA001]
MTRPLFAILSIGIIMVSTASVSSAGERKYRHGYVAPSGPMDRYCLQGRIWGYPGNCQFATYEQCLASASGTNSYCGVNPGYAFAYDPRGQWYPR